MQTQQQHAILSIALMAAFADGSKSDAERDEIRRIADALAGETGTPKLSQLYQDVLLKRVSLAQTAQTLTEPEYRQLAYEMAVCVCDADGSQSDAERRFLAELKGLLQLGSAETAAVEREADALAEVPLTATPTAASAGMAAAAGVPAATPAAASAAVDNTALDATILRFSILNGALELLPQSWASMAIIPLQMKLVYRIGKAYGHELDRGHIKEFIAAAGVGLTSQYIEQFGRKLLGGLFGKVGGSLGRGLGSAATGVAFSFATTYALGQLARRYYAGGRQMSTAVLHDTFQSLLGPAKQLQSQYLPQIEQQSRQIDANQILAMVKGA